MQENNQNLAVPIAIVIAGALIAIGIYFSGGGSSTGISGNQNQVAQKPSDINIKALSANDHIRGSLDAKIVMVEYSDTECPFCKSFHSTLQRVTANYDTNTEVAWSYRQFPIEQLHRKAVKESQATECAADQGKFWEYLDELFRITPSNDGLSETQLPVIAQTVGLDVGTFTSCLNSDKHIAEIKASVAEAATAGANGTPATFFVLKEPMSKKTAEEIELLYAPMSFPDGTLPVKIDKDRNILSISGALPYDLIKGTLDIILSGTK